MSRCEMWNNWWRVSEAQSQAHFRRVLFNGSRRVWQQRCGAVQVCDRRWSGCDRPWETPSWNSRGSAIADISGEGSVIIGKARHNLGSHLSPNEIKHPLLSFHYCRYLWKVWSWCAGPWFWSPRYLISPKRKYFKPQIVKCQIWYVVCYTNWTKSAFAGWG